MIRRRNVLSGTAAFSAAIAWGFLGGIAAAKSREYGDGDEILSELSVRDFGAKGDGLTDDTQAVQAAINAMENYSKILFPGGTYLLGNIIIANKAEITIEGRDAKIAWKGTGRPSLGLQLSGDIDGLEVSGLSFVGDGVTANRHCGLWSNSEAGKTLKNIQVHNCVFNTLVNGIGLTRNRGGRFQDSVFHGNHFTNAVGIAPSEGYAIVVTNETILESCNCVIHSNTFDGAGRHAIYVGRVSDCKVINNKITNHRGHLSAIQQTDLISGLQAPAPAIFIQRSKNILVHKNQISKSYGGAIAVGTDPEKAGFVTRNAVISNNIVTDPRSNLPLFYVGWHDSSEGIEADIIFRDNIVRVDAKGILDSATGLATDYAPPIFSYRMGKRITWIGGSVTVLNCDASSRPDYPVPGFGSGVGGVPPANGHWAPFWLDSSITPGSTDYGDVVVIKNVTIHIEMASGTASALFLGFNFNNSNASFFCEGTKLSGDISTVAYTDTAINNPNIEFKGQLRSRIGTYKT